MPQRHDFWGDSRGSSELMYIALALGIVVTVGGIATTVGSGITADTKQQVKETNFELTDPGKLHIEYTSSNTLSPARVYAMSEGGAEYTIYNTELDVEHPDNSYNGSIQQGDIVFNSRVATDIGVGYGDKIYFIIEESDGGSYTADTVQIPPEESLSLSERKSDGSVSIDNSTLNEQINVNTTAVNATTTG